MLHFPGFCDFGWYRCCVTDFDHREFEKQFYNSEFKKCQGYLRINNYTSSKKFHMVVCGGAVVAESMI
ncbi:hypothetical protein MTR_5g097130 [Medicago truncatula]|uniref:Uncharacterized protein n=1 Tax=Medicago truncatula TaxID=3880 RepID=G7KEL9_MEDTR|nr:hypothetical protein MTR_5g097130 [Medicago truncatula]